MPHQVADNRMRNLLPVAYRDGCARVAERAFDWPAVIAVAARHFSAVAATLFATSAAWTFSGYQASRQELGAAKVLVETLRPWCLELARAWRSGRLPRPRRARLVICHYR